MAPEDEVEAEEEAEEEEREEEAAAAAEASAMPPPPPLLSSLLPPLLPPLLPALARCRAWSRASLAKRSHLCPRCIAHSRMCFNRAPLSFASATPLSIALGSSPSQPPFSRVHADPGKSRSTDSGNVARENVNASSSSSSPLVPACSITMNNTRSEARHALYEGFFS